jgi:ketosteroid isomerase-like protein
MIPAKTTISVAVILWLSAASPASAQQDKASAGGELFDKVQSEFAAAYNRSDIDAMATAFSEDAVRVTPSGIFQGREAIRKCPEHGASQLFSASDRVAIIRCIRFQRWQVASKAGRSAVPRFHGSYTAILGRGGDQVKILEETVTMDAPDK